MEKIGWEKRRRQESVVRRVNGQERRRSRGSLCIRRLLLFCALFGCLLPMLLLSGCAKDTHGLNAKEPITIRIWNYYNGSQLQEFEALIKQFNETEGREKGIVVAVSSQGSVNQTIEAVRAAADAANGELADMFTGYGDLVYEMDEKGLIAALDEYFTEEELEEIVPSYLEEGRMGEGNQLKIFPTVKSTELFFLNKTDWDKFAEDTGADYDDLATWEGVARTAEDYYEWSDAKTPEPDDGKAFFGRDAHANYIIIGSRQLGKEIFLVEDGTAALQLDETIMRRLWDCFYVPYIKGYYTSQGRFSSDDAKTGDVLAFVGSSTGAAYFPAEVIVNDTLSYPIEADILPVPKFEGGEAIVVQQGAGIAVTKSDDTRQYASVCFLKWLTKADRNLEFAVASDYLPVNVNANKSAAIDEYLSKTKGEISELTAKALKTAVTQINSCQPYTSKAFLTGNDARNVLEQTLIDKAKADRELMEIELRLGRSREEAAALFDTDENFQQWYKELKNALEVFFR